MLAAGLSRGLSADSAAFFTFGEWMDYIIQWNRLHDPNRIKEAEKKPNVRMATQKDFDNF